jgi:cytochrome c peroxidase
MSRAAAAVALAALSLAGAAALARAQPGESPHARHALSPLPRPPAGDARKIALGRDLFADRRLSRSGRLACASCHDLASNGASPLARDRGERGALAFNTPTVFNSGLNYRLGWQGRFHGLGDMTLATLRSDQLMGGGASARRLAADAALQRRFRAIYGAAPDDRAAADAIAAFVVTLVTPDAPFDRWLRGDGAALTPQQVRGYTRFKVLGCASCHQGANVGGNLFQRRGIFHPLGDATPRYLRVPSLRNVGVTAPYFHDGSVATVPEAIRQMARAQLDLTIGRRDVADISAFLDSLTGRYKGRPLRAPAAPAPPAPRR